MLNRLGTCAHMFADTSCKNMISSCQGRLPASMHAGTHAEAFSMHVDLTPPLCIHCSPETPASYHTLTGLTKLCLLQVTPSKAAETSKQPAVPADKITLNPTNDMSLDEKLRALDMMHAKAFAEKGRLKEGGVEVATFTRK